MSGWFITKLPPGIRTHSLSTFTQRLPLVQPTAGEQLVDDEVSTAAEGVGPEWNVSPAIKKKKKAERGMCCVCAREKSFRLWLSSGEVLWQWCEDTQLPGCKGSVSQPLSYRWSRSVDTKSSKIIESDQQLFPKYLPQFQTKDIILILYEMCSFFFC